MGVKTHLMNNPHIMDGWVHKDIDRFWFLFRLRKIVFVLVKGDEKEETPVATTLGACGCPSPTERRPVPNSLLASNHPPVHLMRFAKDNKPLMW